jgi:V8-like Glu-specific endopeptidase
MGTFSGLQFNANARGPMSVSHNAAIQIDALYSLFTQGVRNADAWIEETTIDLTPYGQLWVRFDVETGGQYNYSFVDGEFVPVEVGFEPNPSEVSALRQALLAPHTMRVDTLYVAQDTPVSITPFIWPSPVQPVFNTNQAPFRSVGSLVGIRPGSVEFGDDPRHVGTAFMVTPRHALSAAHVFYGYTRVNNNDVRTRLTDARLFIGGTTGDDSFNDHRVRSYWIDSRWVYNFQPDADIAMLTFTRSLNRGWLEVTPWYWSMPQAVNLIGFVHFYGVESHNASMYQSAGPLWYRRPGTSSVLHILQSYSGMSGGPVLDTSNTVVGIHVAGYPGVGPQLYARMVMITHDLMNIIHSAAMM